MLLLTSVSLRESFIVLINKPLKHMHDFLESLQNIQYTPLFQKHTIHTALSKTYNTHRSFKNIQYTPLKPWNGSSPKRRASAKWGWQGAQRRATSVWTLQNTHVVIVFKNRLELVSLRILKQPIRSVSDASVLSVIGPSKIRMDHYPKAC